MGLVRRGEVTGGNETLPGLSSDLRSTVHRCMRGSNIDDDS